MKERENFTLHRVVRNEEGELKRIPGRTTKSKVLELYV